jgi:ferric-dicitrate binding protein FerR (iron transport regulator)
VVAGQIQIDGMPANRIQGGSQFEVVGDAPATIRLTDGSRAEFNPRSKAALRDKDGDNRQVIELTQGGGRFAVARGNGKFRVETHVGTVTALGTEFTVNLQPWPKPKQAMPEGLRLAVSVTSGTVQVEVAGRKDVLHAGSSRIFGDDGQQNQNNDGQQNQKDNGQKNNQGSQPNAQNDNRDKQ